MTSNPLANPNFRPPGIWEKIREDIFGIPRPLSCVQIEITSICAGACAYCPRDAQRESWNARHMQPETFASLWPIMRKSTRAHLQGWGEPLLHPQFMEFQQLAHKAGCLTSTTTSGICMNENLARNLAESGMDIIAFSLAGASANTNSIRRHVPFEKVEQGIKILRQAIKNSKKEPALEIHLAYLLLGDNIQDIQNLPRLMHDWDVDMAVVSTLDYLPAPEFKNMAILPEDTEKIAQAKELLKKAAAEAEEEDRFIHFSLPDTQNKPGCRENVSGNVYINADGFLSPCVYLNVPGNDPMEKRRIFGNSLLQNPWELWQQPDFKEFRSKCLTDEADEVCKNCPKHWE